MENKIYLNLLWLIPLAVWFATRKKPTRLKCTLRGLSFGLVVSHASVGFYHLRFKGEVIEIIDMFMNLFILIHNSAGYKLAGLLNLISPDTATTDAERLLVNAINTIFWMITYGTLGFLWGYFRRSKNKADK